MLTATPGRGPITRVTLATLPDADDAVPARLVPRMTLPPGEESIELDAPANIVDRVELVLPDGRHSHSTGLVITFLDSDAAKAFGRAAYRASVLLAQQIPAGALDSVDRVPPADVSELPDVTYAQA